MNEDAKFICERLKQAADDFTSLGRWGWGLVVVFLTEILIESAKKDGDLFKPLACGAKETNEIARGFLLTIIIAGFAYYYFLRRAKERVVTARTAVLALPKPHGAGLDFAVATVPTDQELRMAMAMRFAILVVLIIVWAMMFEVFKLSGALWCMLMSR